MNFESPIRGLEPSVLLNHNPIVNSMNDMMHIIMPQTISLLLGFYNPQPKPTTSGISDQGFKHTPSSEAHNPYELTS